MPNIPVGQVFTPSSPAVKAFVNREQKLNSRLRDALGTPGKQVVLYGHSGCGKTTLITHELDSANIRFVTTQCMKGMTFDGIIRDAFDQLSPFYTESVTKRGFKIAPEASIEYGNMKASIKAFEASGEKETSKHRILPPQLTAQRLGKFFGDSKCCWIIEDFHKITGSEKIKTSQVMKVFMDLSRNYPALKLIALGAVGTAREVIQYDKEMNNRVSEFLVPYMRPAEIEAIIDTGEKLLNIRFSDAIKRKIIKYSYGLPSICHQLCLNMCRIRRIEETQKNKVALTEDDFEAALERYVDEKSDTLKMEYDRAIKVPNKTKVNTYKLVLEAAIQTGKDDFTFDELLYEVNAKRVSKASLLKSLTELCSTDRSEIMIYDENSNKYRFNNLFSKSYVALKGREEEDDDLRPRTTQDQKMADRLLEFIEREFENKAESDVDDYFNDNFRI